MHRRIGRAMLAIAIVEGIAFGGCSSGAGIAGAPEEGSVSDSTTVGQDSTVPASASVTPAPSAEPTMPVDLPPAAPPTSSGGQAYSIAQAISDHAQETTIAFDALGFLTGTLATDSFFPPGKVADFFGFQYLRDTDPSGGGHATDFLTKAALDTLSILTPTQRTRLITLAKAQVPSIDAYARGRFVLMAAFRRLLAGDLPDGTSGLSRSAVEAYSSTLYRLDGTLSLQRARAYGSILAGLTATQKASLAAMVGRGSASWPADPEPPELRGLAPVVKVAVMTYASDMYSWYAGSLTADTYFCPERQGTYFGSFYLKDAPAAATPDVSIDTRLTAEIGTAALSALEPAQAAQIRGLVDLQRPDLAKIVATRKAVASELRNALAGGTVGATRIAALMTTYGQLDGAISYDFATTFVRVGRTMTTAEMTALRGLRAKLLGSLAAPIGAYLYSAPIAMPAIPSTDFLFA